MVTIVIAQCDVAVLSSYFYHLRGLKPAISDGGRCTSGKQPRSREWRSSTAFATCISEAQSSFQDHLISIVNDLSSGLGVEGSRGLMVKALGFDFTNYFLVNPKRLRVRVASRAILFVFHAQIKQRRPQQSLFSFLLSTSPWRKPALREWRPKS